MQTVVSKIVVGDTDIQESFRRVFDNFLREIEKRQSLIERIFYRTEDFAAMPLLKRYMYVFGVRSYQDFKEILVLMEHGLPTGALKIVRGMYERVVTCIYFSKNANSVEDFAAYDAVHKRKLLMRLPKEVFEGLLPPETSRKVEDEYKAVKARFTKVMCECGREGLMPSWSQLDTYSLALKADKQLANLYGAAFLLPTLHIHSTAAGALGDVEVTPEGFVVDLPPIFSPRIMRLSPGFDAPMGPFPVPWSM
jgi:hypothetical protein